MQKGWCVMPPKPKFTKEEILDTAFRIVCENGMEALTARELGARLGSSARPIFTVFADMDDLKQAVRVKAKERFDAYMKIAEAYTPAYKKRGMQWVKFASENPKLFRLLFMNSAQKAESFEEAVQIMPFGMEDDIRIIMRDYHASREQAGHLFQQMWTYTYGLCVLCAARVCTFSDEEIALRLGEIFRGMVYIITSAEKPFTGLTPTENGTEESREIEKLHPDFAEADEERKG